MYEPERLVDAIKHLTKTETRSVLRYHHWRNLRSFAAFVGADADRYALKTIDNIYDRIHTEIECDGCGGVSTASGLRWQKADRGEPVTISVNERNKPQSLNYLTPELIVEHWFKPWSDVCDIKFRLLSRAGDIRIGFKPLEDSVLGIALVPRGAEFMEQGGELSGDIWMDSDRVWTPRMERGTGCHEGGHAIGLEHIDSRSALLYTHFLGFTVPQQLDIEAALVKYPYETGAIAA